MNDRFADEIQKAKNIIEEATVQFICDELRRHGLEITSRFEDSLRIRVSIEVHPI